MRTLVEYDQWHPKEQPSPVPPARSTERSQRSDREMGVLGRGSTERSQRSDREMGVPGRGSTERSQRSDREMGDPETYGTVYVAWPAFLTYELSPERLGIGEAWREFEGFFRGGDRPLGVVLGG